MPKGISEEIAKIQKSLPRFIGKSTEKENLHLTLKFLGEVDREMVNKVKDRLRRVKFESFDTEIKEIGFFDNRKSTIYNRSLILWLYLTNCEELQKQIDIALKDLFNPERRFMSHLTIARIKRVKNKEFFFEQLNGIKIKDLKFKVTEFKLKESALTEKGPKYKDLEIYPLK